MSYTTKQRNEIYKKALVLLKDEYFLCRSLKIAMGWRPDFYQKDLFEVFPEFELFRPDKFQYVWNFSKSNNMLYKGNLRPRQIILDFCIAMTEN